MRPLNSHDDLLGPARRLTALAVVLLLLIGAETRAGYLVWKYKLQYRYEPVTSLNSLPPAPQSLDLPEYRARLAKEEWATQYTDTLGRAIAALRWSRNRVWSVANNEYGYDPEELLRSVE